MSISPTTSVCACLLGVINRVRRRWSSTQDRRRASCFCRAGGSSSAPSRGRHALGAWSRITNGSETVAGLHFVAFACLMLARAVLAFGPDL